MTVLERVLPAVMLVGVMVAGGVNAAPPTAHCACLEEASAAYDPEQSVDDGAMRTLEVERRVRLRERISDVYRRCMSSRGARDVPEPFPTGLSVMADGPEFHPAACRGVTSG